MPIMIHEIEAAKTEIADREETILNLESDLAKCSSAAAKMAIRREIAVAREQKAYWQGQVDQLES